MVNCRRPHLFISNDAADGPIFVADSTSPITRASGGCVLLSQHEARCPLRDTVEAHWRRISDTLRSNNEHGDFRVRALLGAGNDRAGASAGRGDVTFFGQGGNDSMSAHINGSTFFASGGSGNDFFGCDEASCNFFGGVGRRLHGSRQRGVLRWHVARGARQRP